MCFRGYPDPTREVPSGFEASGVGNERLHRHCDDRADARDGRKAPHLIILPGLDYDLTFELVDLCGKHLDLIDDFGKGKPIVAIQRASVKAWARLFDIPAAMAFNR